MKVPHLHIENQIGGEIISPTTEGGKNGVETLYKTYVCVK